MNDQSPVAAETAMPAITKHDHPSFIATGEIPWMPWVMPGTEYKLMAVDAKTGGFTLFLKIAPGAEAPVHRHVGAIEGVILEGGFQYGDDDIGRAGDFILEHGAAVHQPHSPNGCIMFAVAHGPLMGYNEDGSIQGVLDAEAMYRMAVDQGVGAHLGTPFG